MRGAVTIAGLLLAATAPSPASAQLWTAEARIGQLDFQLSPTGAPPATTMAVGLGAAAEDFRFGLSGGIPMGEEDPLWGALDLRDRSDIDVGAVTLGIEGGGQAFVQRYDQSIETPGGPFQPPTLTEEAVYGWGAAAQVLPFVAYRRGMARVEARAGGSFYRNALDDRSASRTVALGDVRVIAAPARAVALTVEARHFIAEEASYTFAGAGTVFTLPGLDLWGTVGTWLDDAATATPWSVGAAWSVAERLDLVVDAREDALDPVYGSAPRRSWSAAIRVRLAGEDAPPAEPVPAAYDGRTATIALPARDAGEAPRIAGDFTDWTPVAMSWDGERWVWRGALEPGVYEYAFVGPDGEWFVPASVPGRKDDGMGGWVALLIVEEPGS